MASQTRSQAVRQSFHLRIAPSFTKSSSDTLATQQDPTPTVLDNTSQESILSADEQMPDSIMFSVLCMFDFSGEEEQGLLSFKKNQILDIIKRDDTGWWAAMPDGGAVVGWIPQAYVSPLSEEMAKRLRNVREEFRIPEFEAEQLYNSTSYEITLPVFEADSANTSSSLEDYEVYTTHTMLNPRPAIELYPSSVDENASNPIPRRFSKNSRLQPPPSPNAPVPGPPSSSRDKPMPPTPTASDDGIKKKRSIRRKPLLVNDNSTLAQLSSILEYGDTKEIDRLVRHDTSPSFEAISKRSREERLQRKKAGEDMKQIRRNKSLPLSPYGLKPRYMRLIYEDQIDEDEKGYIRSATLPALIERLTTQVLITDPDKLAEYSNFTKIFLTTFRTFTTADQLFESLAGRFNMKTPKSLTDIEYRSWKMNIREPVRHRIFELFGLWLAEYRLLEEEPHIATRLTDFLSTLPFPYKTTAEDLTKEVERLTFSTPADLTLNEKSKKSKKIKPYRIDLLKLSPTSLAEQLALYEHALYVKVTYQECLSYAKTQTGEKVCRLVEFCSTYDKLGAWVKESILTTDILLKRAETVDFWVKVAEKSRTLNNIASMSAIISALSSTVVSMLHLTWIHVKRKAQLELLLKHNQPKGGFAGYRALHAQAEGPCVPFITMYLSDIMHAREQFTPDDGRILFYQRARWYETIVNITKFQTRKYPFTISESIAAHMDLHLKGTLRDEEWFWTKGQEVQRVELAHADIRKGLEAAGF